MNKIVLALDEKTVENKVTDGVTIAPLLVADSNPQIKAAGNALAAQSKALSDKDVLRDQKQAEAKAATEGLHTQEGTWDDSIKAAAAKVTEVYPNNPEKWKSFDFQVSGAPAPVGIPAKVANLSVSDGDNPATADLHWNSIKKVNGYKIQTTEGDPTVETNWKSATPDISTKSSVTATGLTSGKQTWFRVCAFNAAGQGAWSDPVGKIIS